MSSIRKGKEFERAIVRKLKAAGLKHAKRCLQYQREHGAPDVDAWPFWIECKSGKRVAVAAVYRDVAKKCRVLSVPLVVHKSSRTGPALVTLALDDLLRATKKGGGRG